MIQHIEEKKQKARKRERYKKYRDKSKLTIKGKTRLIYNNQKKTSKRRNHHQPKYTLKELREWLINEPNFLEIYNNWINNGRKTKEMPTVDRIDNTKGYFFGNIQVLTFEENIAKEHYNNECEKFTLVKRKLTDEQVIEIYNLKGKISCTKLSKKYNIGESTIRRIWNKQSKYLKDILT